MTPKTGMVLAAGRGERLRPITDRLPKPLVRIAGRTLLDHAIDRLQDAGVERVVVNVHYLGNMIVEHLKARRAPEIVFSTEEVPLDTGGAVARALPLLGTEPFYVVNGDSLWLDGKVPALRRLAGAWDDGVDAVLLLQRTVTAVGFDGIGDFLLDQLGYPRRPHQREVPPYLFAGIQLLSPALFREVPAGPFTLNVIYDRAAEAGRLRAIVHDGTWYHVSTPEGMNLVHERLESTRVER